MKTVALVLLTALAASAQAQMAVPAPSPGDAPIRRPADPGMSRSPANSGAVVVPPSTGNEEIVKTPPKNVDPAIDDATGDVDRRNRRLSEDKDKDRPGNRDKDKTR
ncbi:hypothetical protein [Noviherbaspirillum aridicola]|uniref:Uncharacterized protein n=1 Tax=Noviherbaspirillum aridicola TaxID=2849687 RepID=A0ABQ4Q8L6_9BURK|nr:hypothetical protein [Noviherbaspirillum aridicola]GIZ53044.1 hypothetical protein NCCP691_30580 [Noviherbaspirillum aridicola]